MIIDSQEQKDLLIQCLNAVPLSGAYSQVRGVIAKMDELIVAISQAEVKKPGLPAMAKGALVAGADNKPNPQSSLGKEYNAGPVPVAESKKGKEEIKG